MKLTICKSLLIVLFFSVNCLCQASDKALQTDSKQSDAVYFTHGVHNEFGCKTHADCIAERKKHEPSDPVYPTTWISDWTMFRVFDNYQENMPPYSNPPSTLKADDYQVSYGATYYDSGYVPADKDGYGAMMEHYDQFCLPIFPIKNNFTCSFISLGNKAYFLTYDEDRPNGMPQCCLFSPRNHPPRRDFIKHLPYNEEYSQHLNGSVQAYAYWADGPQGKILFGYAFNKDKSPGVYGADSYRHPQSFFFSGYPNKPVNAPIVSQNYTSFRQQTPDPAYTWDLVSKMCPSKPVACQLFDPPAGLKTANELNKSSGWERLGQGRQ